MKWSAQVYPHEEPKCFDKTAADIDWSMIPSVSTERPALIPYSELPRYVDAACLRTVCTNPRANARGLGNDFYKTPYDDSYALVFSWYRKRWKQAIYFLA